jgi:hypothetical protein
MISCLSGMQPYSLPTGWHALNLALHGANSILVCLLARRMRLAPVAAWFAGALFAVHGIRPEAVVWIAGRFDLLAFFSAASLGWLAWQRQDQRRLTYSLGFLLFSVLPPLHMMLIGPDLEKSRLLYLGSAGFCFLLAAAVDGVKKPALLLAPAIVLAFNLVALGHNLKLWRYVSDRAQAACESIVECADAVKGKVVVEAVPSLLRGVYFLGNGLPDGVAMRRADLLPRIEIRRAGSGVEAGTDDCRLRWDNAADGFRRISPQEEPAGSPPAIEKR